MTLAQLGQAMEAILFAGGEPVPIQRIAQALEQESAVVEHLAQRLQERYESSGSGLELLRLEDSYQLATRPELQTYVKAALEVKRGQAVSPAALEVLGGCLQSASYQELCGAGARSGLLRRPLHAGGERTGGGGWTPGAARPSYRLQNDCQLSALLWSVLP